jgi:release factor glutamine methyltransferase
VTLKPHPVTALCDLTAVQLREAGVESFSLEAQILVGLAFGLSRTDVLLGREVHHSSEQLAELERLISERIRRVPLAYLRGTQEFYGLTFEVSPAVLIPRPETELLVELAVKRLRTVEYPVLVDVGTGSGCIPIAAAHELSHLHCLAVDISEDALAVARRNAERNGVAGRVRFLRGDILRPVRSGSADVVVSNPPYIPSAELETLQPEVRDFEPRLALDGGADGFTFHRRLAAGARRVLKPSGLLAVEVAMGQVGELADLLRNSGYVAVGPHPDLAGIERVVTGVQPEG